MNELNKRIEKAMAGKSIIESVDNKPSSPTWSLAYLMSNPKIATNAIHVEHPALGDGVVTDMNESEATVNWNRLDSWTKHSGKVNINEAGIIVVSNFDKYLRDQKLSEEIDMSKNIISANEYLSLMEDIGSDTENPMAPDPNDSIMTNVEKSPESSDALSGRDGNGGATNKPYEEKNKHKGSEGTSLADLDGDGGAINKPYEEKSHSEAPEDRTVATMGKSKSTAVDESWTFEDADFDDMDDDAEDDMDMGAPAGGLSMTTEFLSNLLNGVSEADLDADDIDKIVDCIDSCSGDGTLDVEDIARVMEALQNSVGATDEDVAQGDGEPAGDEGGDEYEGETQLMGDMDECSDDMEECSGAGMGDTADDKKDGKLKEAWMGTIPNVGNPRKVADTSGMTDEEIEFADLKRLAGMK